MGDIDCLPDTIDNRRQMPMEPIKTRFERRKEACSKNKKHKFGYKKKKFNYEQQ